MRWSSCSTSCEKILTEEPKSSAAEVFYNTAPEVETAVNAIYGPLRDPNCLSGLYPAQIETYGDYIYGRGSYLPLNAYQTLDNTNITRTGQMWDQFYRAIRNANLVIANAPKGSNISAADVAKFVAEAKFLRAFTYFLVVKNWSGVPIRTEENMTEQDVPKSSEAQVYDLIVKDLTDAEAALPDVSSLPGRPSRWSAKSVLAEVYMYQKKYTEAMQKTNEVIVSGKFSLVPVTVNTDFEKIFGPDVVTTSEEIFYLKFSRQGSNQGWQYVMFAHHPGARYHGAGGFYAHYSDSVTNPAIAKWSTLIFAKHSTFIVTILVWGKLPFSSENSKTSLPVRRLLPEMTIRFTVLPISCCCMRKPPAGLITDRPHWPLND